MINALTSKVRFKLLRKLNVYQDDTLYPNSKLAVHFQFISRDVDGIFSLIGAFDEEISNLSHQNLIIQMNKHTLVRRNLGMVVAQKKPEFLIFRRSLVIGNWRIPNF